jgi:hypothetical protein
MVRDPSGIQAASGRSAAIQLAREAMGLSQSSKRQASRCSRRAIEEMFGEDLLANHHPRTITRRMADDADLIPVMEENLLNPKVLPPEKTFALKAYFGLPGHIEDAWPDRDDDESMSRYRNCCRELKTILESNLISSRYGFGTRNTFRSETAEPNIREPRYHQIPETISCVQDGRYSKAFLRLGDRTLTHRYFLVLRGAHGPLGSHRQQLAHSSGQRFRSAGKYRYEILIHADAVQPIRQTTPQRQTCLSDCGNIHSKRV